MNTPSPNLVEALNRPMDASSKATLVGGTPLATISVWLLEIYLKPRGLVLEAPVAVAFGIVGATVFGELWTFFMVFVQRLLEKLK